MKTVSQVCSAMAMKRTRNHEKPDRDKGKQGIRLLVVQGL